MLFLQGVYGSSGTEVGYFYFEMSSQIAIFNKKGTLSEQPDGKLALK